MGMGIYGDANINGFGPGTFSGNPYGDGFGEGTGFSCGYPNGNGYGCGDGIATYDGYGNECGRDDGIVTDIVFDRIIKWERKK